MAGNSAGVACVAHCSNLLESPTVANPGLCSAVLLPPSLCAAAAALLLPQGDMDGNYANGSA